MKLQPLPAKARLALAHPSPSIEAYEGSVRSGKTIATLIDWARYIRTGPAGQLAMCGRTERTVINNLVLPMQEMFGPSRVRINYGSGVVTIFGRKVHLYGANNEQARTKIQGATLAGAYVDEASTLPESFFNMLYTRLSVPGAKLWLTANPEGPKHWLKTKWLDKARLWVDGKGRVIEQPADVSLELHRYTFLLDDNDALDPAYVDRTKRSYSGVFRRRYIDAEWVAAEGSVYDQFDEDRHVIPFAETPQIARVLAAGIDYGTTNPTSALILGLTAEQHPRLVFLDEYRHDPETHGKLTDAEQSRRIRAFLAGRHHPTQALPPAPYTVIDPAAASLKVQLHHDRHTGIWDAANEVLPGIKLMSSLIATDQLLITDRCKGLIGELPGYVWDDKKTEKGEDAPVKANDHSVDAARYAVFTTQALWRTALRFTEEVTNAPSQGPGLAAA